jgi:multidrug efflux pump
VNWCVQHRWITIGATLLTFALGIVGMGKVQQQFFPDSSRPEIMVDPLVARRHGLRRQRRGGQAG